MVNAFACLYKLHWELGLLSPLNILVLINVTFVTIKEYDHPHLLLQNPKGWLTKMVNKTGAENAADLKRRAYEVIELLAMY